MKKTHTNPKESNSAITYYCQFGDISDAPLRAALKLLVHILKEPTFTQLRTKEQLGYVATLTLSTRKPSSHPMTLPRYVVALTMWSSAGSMGLGFKIQSLKSPAYVEERIDAFVQTYRATLASCDLASFELRRNALVDKLLERPKNLVEETTAFADHIDGGYHDFSRSECPEFSFFYSGFCGGGTLNLPL